MRPVSMAHAVAKRQPIEFIYDGQRRIVIPIRFEGHDILFGMEIPRWALNVIGSNQGHPKRFKISKIGFVTSPVAL